MTAPTAATPTPPQDSSPVFNTRSFADLVEDLRSSEGRATVLIGAGCSFSGGIPLAGGIIEDIRKTFPQAWQRARQKAGATSKPSYNQYMHELNPDQRRTLLKRYIDRSKINWAHIGLAQLLKHKRLDRVLTTNFDQLITRACALVNVFPAVYDLTAFHPTQMRMAELPDLAVFHLHGQRNGFSLLNDPDELARHAQQLKPVFDHARERRLWIVVGYSGEADPLLALIQSDCHQCGLYWISTQPTPKPHLAELFSAERYAFHLHHSEGADHFFMKLARDMNAWPPMLLDQPFAHLREQLTPIAEFIEDGKQNDKPYYHDEPNGIDWLKQTRRLQDQAETLLKADVSGQDSPAHPSQDVNAYLIGGVSVLQDSTDPDVQSWAWVRKGDAQAYEAQSLAESGDLPTARALWQQAGECYAQALEIKPDKHEAANNWGGALYQEAQALAKRGDLPAARALWRQAGECYAQALEIKPDKHEAAYNWGVALNDEAKALAASYLSDLPAAQALWRQAGERYAQALAIKPDKHEAANNWGCALDDEAQALAESDLPAARALWQQAGERYAQALEIKPDMHEAAYNWGSALAQEAQALATSDLVATRALWQQAGERYAQALAIKPDLYQATLGWSIALLQESQAIHDTHPDEAATLLSQAEALLLPLEVGQPGLAAYNLACIAALRHRPADAIHWLRSCQTHGTLLSEEHLRTDPDLDPIRDTPEFTAWWAEVFGRGDAAMG